MDKDKESLAKDTNNEMDNMTVEEHLKKNRKNAKVKINWKEIVMYIIMIIIVIVCGILLFFLWNSIAEKELFLPQGDNLVYLPPTEPTTLVVDYNTTTKLATRATHTVFDANKVPGPTSEPTPTRIPPRVTTTSSSTTVPTEPTSQSTEPTGEVEPTPQPDGPEKEQE